MYLRLKWNSFFNRNRKVTNQNTMKKTIIVLLCLLTLQFFWSCKETDDGVYTDPISLYEKIGGSWKLTSIKEIDEIAKASSIKPDEMNLTSKFNFSTFVITLAVDSTFNPTTYEVKGTAPDLFNRSGYWELDYPFPHPDNIATKILLYNDAEKTQLTDKLIVSSIPGAKATMQFNLQRLSEGTPYVTYQYTFKPEK